MNSKIHFEFMNVVSGLKSSLIFHNLKFKQIERKINQTELTVIIKQINICFSSLIRSVCDYEILYNKWFVFAKEVSIFL